jgi:hypothetical protein
MPDSLSQATRQRQQTLQGKHTWLPCIPWVKMSLFIDHACAPKLVPEHGLNRAVMCIQVQTLTISVWSHPSTHR